MISMGTCLLNIRILINTCLLNLGILIGTCLLKSVPLIFELAVCVYVFRFFQLRTYVFKDSLLII